MNDIDSVTFFSRLLDILASSTTYFGDISNHAWEHEHKDVWMWTQLLCHENKLIFI